MWLDNAWRDLQYAVRTLGRAPGFTAVAILTLALGIGANSAMFSVVYGILLRPLPYRDANRLVLVQREQDMSGAHRPVPAYFLQAETDAWQRRSPSFESMAFYSVEIEALARESGTEVLDSAVVSGTFFSTLDGPLVAGRPLGAADDRASVAVISERASRRLFGGSQTAIGQLLILSSHPYTVVGVAASAFQFPSPETDVWVPAGLSSTVNPRCCGFRMLGRLKVDQTVARAAGEADALAKSLALSAPGRNSDVRATVVSLRDQMVGTVRPALLILFAAVGLVLLVACANVVNLLVARHVTREREIAIRRALGASGRRLVAQSMIESALLATAGSAMGIALAIASVRVLTHLEPPGVPRLDAVHVDIPVLLFSSLLAAVAALATGILPALRLGNTTEALRFGAVASTSATTGRRLRRALCVTELAVSLVLLVGASLLGRSLVRLMHTDLGIAPDHVVTASMNLAFGGRPTDAQTLARIERVAQRIRALPGVRAVGVGTALPPTASGLRLTMRRTGETVDYQATGVAATPGYFQALGMRLVKGRLFTSGDDVDHPPVMMMSVDTARRFFGDGDPIGRTMSLPANRNGVNGSQIMTLVGILANVKYSGLDAAADDAVYRPFAQQTWVAPYLVARMTGEPAQVAPDLGRAIAAVDRGIVVSDARALDSIVSDAAAPARFRAVLLAAIAGLALLMAVVGLYGVVAHSVTQRTREFGVRMALGAQGEDVLAMVLRESVRLAACGIICGLGAAYAATRTLAGLLYGISPTDVASFGLAAAGLLVVALVASYVPARRATKVDPLIALRCE